MKDKLIVIHPALAPYRIDFFNSIATFFNAIFYFQFRDPLEQKFSIDNIQSLITFIPHYLKPSLKIPGIKNLRWEVFSILYKERPDYVLCSEYNIQNFIIIAYKYLFNRKMKVISLCDDSYNMTVSYSYIKKWIRKRQVSLEDGIIIADKKTYEWYQHQFFNLTQFLYFPIIQSQDKFRKALCNAQDYSQNLINEYDLNDNKLLLYVGRLVKIKNVCLLLNILPYIIKKYPKVKLIIVGDGDEKCNLIKQAEELKICDHILFVGKKEGYELYAWYRLADIFILPSIYEPFGAVTNEALLANCYVFCSNIAGSASLIEEQRNGMLFDPEDGKELTKKLLDYLGQVNDKKKNMEGNNMIISYEEMILKLVSFIKSMKY